MKKIIHHIRRQPEKVKRQILHLVTIVAGVILISLWVYSLGTNLSNAKTEEKIEGNLQPFKVLKDNVPPLW